ncbi:membrane fusion protein, multidrug efflux system [Dyadobacter soli]|uniref:Membrane fusion protein, multidrug efflux system n=1 Tax=Dyadobacter soli TaxID=659014 RepID=A0A1G6VL16_9BACT|nr:HlyD family secretion protein [Dyadobacter soli]SDD53546.1 membrane fusion protein, multidrug efflux system [Dyadobacter soli]
MTTSSKSPIGRLLTNGAALLLILAILSYTSDYMIRSNEFAETNDAQVEAYINPISARAGGYIQRVLYTEHQQVKKGDTLIVIDDREYRAKLLEAEATLEDAEAQLTVLSAGIQAAHIGALVNRHQIRGANARLTQQRKDLARYQNLIDEEAVTGQELEQITARHDVAASEFSSAEENLKSTYARIAELESRRALILADIKKKQAQLTFARINLGYTVITAPYDGQVGRKTIIEGQQIQPGQPLVSIVNKKEKWVTANFKETQLGHLYIGQDVSIAVDGLNGKRYYGQVEAISPSTGSKFSLLPPDNSTGNFVKVVQRIPVKIKLTRGDVDLLRAGMSVIVSAQKVSRQ